MLKPLYTIQQFSEKVSKLSTLKELIALCQEPTIDLSITTSALEMSWNAKSDAITSGGKIVFQLAININGNSYETSMGQEIVITSLSNLEATFLEALKKAICISIK